jgi:methylphosphotriester-DNA--protein-cysteine methyltransferase
VARALEYIWLNAQNRWGCRRSSGTRACRAGCWRCGSSGVGVTLQDELQRTRLKRVHALLAETNHSVRAIAHACGFTSASYLGKVFRRTFGMTMTQYRARR